MAINPIPLGPSIVVPQQDYSGVGRFFDDLVKQRQEDKAAALLSSYFAGGAPPAEQKSFFGSLIDGGKRALGIEDSSQPAQPTQTASIPQTPGTGAVGLPQSTSSGGIGSDYAARTAAVESGGNPTAKNPRSSASGPYQFTDGTWIENFDKTFPRMAAYSPEQKLAIRDNPKFRGQQDQVFKTFTAGNEAALTKAGVPLDDTARYAAHFFGAGDAPKVLTAPAETPIENIVSPASIEANPFLKGMTAGDARGWLQSKMQSTPQREAPAGAGYGMAAVGGVPQAGMPERLRQFLPALLANPGTRAMGVQLASQYSNPDQWVMQRDTQGNLYQRNSKTGELKVVDKSTLLSPQELQQQIEKAKAGATRVNVTNSGERAYDQERDKSYAKYYIEGQDTGRKASNAISTLNIMGKLTEDPNFYSGTGGEAVTKFKRGLVALGITDTKGASANELFSKLSNKMVLDAMGGSLGNQISNADRDFIQNTAANIGNTPEGNRQIIELAKKIEQRKIEVAKMQRAYAKSHGGRIDAGFDEELAQWANDPKNALFPQSVPGSGAAPAQQGQQGTPPVQGARKAPDGRWYVPDPGRPGKYLQVQ